MSAVVFAFGPCFACKQGFMFNPDLVPSIRVDATGHPDPAGEKEPVCKSCIERANVQRKAAGVALHVIMPGAYEAVPVDEI